MLAVLARDEIALCQRSHLERDGWARQSGACGQRLLLGPAFVLVVRVVGKREQHQLLAGGKRLAKRPCDCFKTHGVFICSEIFKNISRNSSMYVSSNISLFAPYNADEWLNPQYREIWIDGIFHFNM
jgi:hypothetical protein